jgi:hypothetical protein
LTKVNQLFWEAGLISQAIVPLFERGQRIGRVHSVFRRAVNIVFDGTLITVTRPELGTMPNGIVVEGDRDFQALGIEVGMKVVLRGASSPPTPFSPTEGEGGLVFPDALLTIGLRHATRWSPRLSQIGPGKPSIKRRVNLDRAMALAAAHAPHRGFGPLLALLAPSGLSAASATIPPMCEYAYQKIVGVIRAIEQEDLAMAIEAAEMLIGLGDGLTPSGDDFLVGFGAAIAAVGQPLAARFLECCAELARVRTTFVGAALLAHAARGEYTARLKALLTTLLTGTERDVAEQIPIVLAWGSTSGADLLLGVLVGLVVGIRRPVEAL